MKKILLTVALVLAIVSSLTAGTMAAYTKTLPTLDDEVKAKDFNIKVTANEFWNKASSKKLNVNGVKIAPGETVWYHFTIQNHSTEEHGVAADISATAELEGDLAKVCKVEMFMRASEKEKFKSKGNATTDKSYVSNNGKVINTDLLAVDSLVKKVGVKFINVPPRTSADRDDSGGPYSVGFYLKITWPTSDTTESNAADSAMVLNRDTPASLRIKFNVNATSHDEHTVYNEKGEATNSDKVRGKVEELGTSATAASWETYSAGFTA